MALPPDPRGLSLWFPGGQHAAAQEKATRYFSPPSHKSGDALGSCLHVALSSSPAKRRHYITARRGRTTTKQILYLTWGTLHFEDVVIQELRKVGIKAECYTHRVGKEEYQCDVLFSIDNKDVYICECKSWGMFLTPNGYYEHEVKIHDAKKQLDRIAEAFEKEKGLIEQILQVTCIRKVYRLIITNIPVGINNRCESTQIIDFYALKKFLSREKPSISLLSKSQQLKYTYKGFSMYDGNVTCLRMQKFLENPAPVDISRKLIKKVKPEIEIGKYSIEYEFSFEEHRSPDSIDETDQIRQLIED